MNRTNSSTVIDRGCF